MAGLMAAGMMIVGSVAYFTDRASENDNITVGNLKVQLSNVALDTSNVIAPGCIIPFTYDVANVGTLALDEREKIALTVYESDGSTPVALSSSPSEFEVYKASDVELVTGKGYAPKSGANPVGTRVTDGFDDASSTNKIIYQIDQTALDGSDDELSDVNDTSLSRDYVILFKGASSNKFQDVKVVVDVLVEAKQHAYTDAYNSDWSELQSGSISFSTGNQNVVPSRDE